MTRWPIKPLGELLKVQNGFAFKSELFNEDGKGLPIIRIRDLARGFSETFFDGEHDPAFEVENGDFLIGMDGEFHCYRWQGGKALLNQRVCRLQNFSHDLNPGYVFYGINDHLREIEDNTAFVTVKHLSSKQIASIEMSVPTLPEQERIVKLLDEADELRKLRAQADRRTADLIPALFNEMFGDPTHLEKMRWSFKPLGEFAKVSYGLADKLDATTKPENGTRILTISNVLLHGSIDTRVEKYSVVEPAERAKARLQHFDLLFNWRNGSEEHVGKTAIWEKQVEGEVLHVSFLLKIRADLEQANPYFLWALINRLRATGYFTRNARMQINRKFNASELSALKLPLPPLELQKEFAARVSDIRAMQAEQAASRRRLDDLFQSMLHRAFQGEL
jgi:type I restriction enzyme S subunit